MTEYTFENELVSDLHKDARNHRPTSGFMAMWNDLNDDQKQECWDNLIAEMKLSQEQEKASESAALSVFKTDLAMTMQTLMKDWKGALVAMARHRENIVIDSAWSAENSQNLEHFLWKQGIGFGKIDEIITKFFGGTHPEEAGFYKHDREIFYKY